MSQRQKTVSRILEIKGSAKEQVEVEVRKSRDRLSAEETKLRSLEDEYKNKNDEFVLRHARGTVPVHEVELFYSWCRHLTDCIDKQKMTIARCTEEHECVMQALLEAHKEHRLFEILHDRLQQAKARETEKAEQKQADFTYLSRRDRE